MQKKQGYKNEMKKNMLRNQCIGHWSNFGEHKFKFFKLHFANQGMGNQFLTQVGVTKWVIPSYYATNPLKMG